MDDPDVNFVTLLKSSEVQRSSLLEVLGGLKKELRQLKQEVRDIKQNLVYTDNLQGSDLTKRVERLETILRRVFDEFGEPKEGSESP